MDKADNEQESLLGNIAHKGRLVHMTNTIYTIGHSTRTIDEFIRTLQAFEIGLVVDVRTITKSRHNPQFNESSLRQELQRANIGYVHLKELGGLRHATKKSINAGWKNSSFRGFADYMQTPGFQEGIQRLLKIAVQKRTVIMCAEAVPWRCHRSLIGDALMVRNVHVEHIMSEKASRSHKLTSWAEIDGQTITYPEQGNEDKPYKQEKTIQDLAF